MPEVRCLAAPLSRSLCSSSINKIRQSTQISHAEVIRRHFDGTQAAVRQWTATPETAQRMRRGLADWDGLDDEEKARFADQVSPVVASLEWLERAGGAESASQVKARPPGLAVISRSGQ